MAHTEAATRSSSDELYQLVSFSLDREVFGVDILNVQEINRMVGITRVPNSPPHVRGVINLRGKVIPIVDLRSRLGMEPRDPDNQTRVIVVEIADTVVGFVVDSVNEVLRIPKSVTEPPPQIAAGVDAGYITAVGKLEDRLLILLDLKHLVDEEIRSFAA